jgi:hypothetical protein
LRFETRVRGNASLVDVLRYHTYHHTRDPILPANPS